LGEDVFDEVIGKKVIGNLLRAPRTQRETGDWERGDWSLLDGGKIIELNIVRFGLNN
jgi:hypothetical protein